MTTVASFFERGYSSIAFVKSRRENRQTRHSRTFCQGGSCGGAALTLLYAMIGGEMPMSGRDDNRVRYVKPNMAALEGDMGRKIYETILNAPDTDWATLHERSRAIERRIAKASALSEQSLDVRR